MVFSIKILIAYSKVSVTVAPPLLLEFWIHLIILYLYLYCDISILIGYHYELNLRAYNFILFSWVDFYKYIQWISIPLIMPMRLFTRHQFIHVRRRIRLQSPDSIKWYQIVNQSIDREMLLHHQCMHKIAFFHPKVELIIETLLFLSSIAIRPYKTCPYVCLRARAHNALHFSSKSLHVQH